MQRLYHRAGRVYTDLSTEKGDGNMILPRISRRAALILGKAAGAVIFTVVCGAVAWLLDKERKAVQAEAIRQSEEPEVEFSLPREIEDLPETEDPSAGAENGDGDEA